MANYISSLTGAQLDDALTQVEQRVPEGWAVGEREGIPVSSSSPYYHNNAKYYAETAGQTVQQAAQQVVEDATAQAERAEDAANRAEAAVPAGTAGAVFFDRIQTLTDAQKGQAKANIGAGSTSPNLLNNPWFTVNQRGASGYLSDGYRLDRWKVFTSGGTVNYNLTTGYVTLSATSNVAYIQQILEPKLREALNGRTVTFSVLTSANVVHSVTFTYDSTATDIGIPFPTFPQAGYWYGGDYASCLRVSYGNRTVTLSIKAIKLELGSVSTIANDMPPDYGEELAKCQRYFVRIPKQLNRSYGFGYAQGSESIRIAVPIPVTMRDAPTISYTGGFTLRGNGANLTPTDISVLSSAPIGCVNLSFTVSNAVSNQAYVLSSTESNTYIDLSADL